MLGLQAHFALALLSLSAEIFGCCLWFCVWLFERADCSVGLDPPRVWLGFEMEEIFLEFECASFTYSRVHG